MERRTRWRRIRTATVLTITIAALAVLLHGCPTFRDGMAGNLARAQKSCESATQSAIFAVDLWRSGKSTGQLAAVQVTDARDEVKKNYDGVAALTAEHEDDLRHQQALLDAMTDAITALNIAGASIRGVDTATPLDVVRQRLSDALSRLSAVSR